MVAANKSVNLASQQKQSSRPTESVDVLYKYVTAERALTCIPEVGDGTLRATQPAALNDPFECAVMPLYVIRDEAEENRELAGVLEEINPRIRITAEDVGRARLKYGSLFTRQLFAEQVSTRFGIVSFTTRPFHPLMWSHYTIDGSGFVIGYNTKELSTLASNNEYLREVTYGNRPPPIMGPIVLVSPGSNLPKILANKSIHWSYESEWRLIVELKGTIGTGKIDQHRQPINLIQVPNEAMVSVYYTERTPPESVKKISDRLADENNRYRVGKPQKLLMSSTSYGYELAREEFQS